MIEDLPFRPVVAEHRRELWRPYPSLRKRCPSASHVPTDAFAMDLIFGASVIVDGIF